MKLITERACVMITVCLSRAERERVRKAERRALFLFLSFWVINVVESSLKLWLIIPCMQPSNVFVVTNFRFASPHPVLWCPCLFCRTNPHLYLGRLQVDSVSFWIFLYVRGEISDIQVFSKHNKNLILLCVFIIVFNFFLFFCFLFVQLMARAAQTHLHTGTHIFILQHKTGERLRIKL